MKRHLDQFSADRFSADRFSADRLSGIVAGTMTP
jgi:hypothetical protein